ncbi:alpha/beta fold hydrolase [Piscinibacter sakaiensis]|uniref:alpha/beta fold hydrolase n=1 Tax=Piscinibacter sakaiensis TaxID=1547922 RepID=UPI003AAE9BF4
MIETFDVELPHGIRIACRAAGDADAPLLVLLHGFPEAAFVWDEVITRLADRFRCVAPNLRGYAPSSVPSEVESYRPAHLVGDIAALVERLGGDAVLVAHDWGGAVAWNLAARQPAGLRRLVIINAPHPATFLRELRDNPQQQAASAYMNFLVRPDAGRLLAENDFERLWRFFEALGESPGCDWLDEPTRARYRALWQQGLDGPLNYYRATPLRPPTASDSAVNRIEFADRDVTVTLPTLVIWGEADRALPPSLLDGLERWVPSLHIERIAHASHWVIHEQPDRIAELIGNFAAG